MVGGASRKPEGVIYFGAGKKEEKKKTCVSEVGRESRESIVLLSTMEKM